MPANTANGKEAAMADKYEEMAHQMRADGVDEEMIERFVAEERAEDEFRRGRGTASFASGYSLRMRDGFVLIEGRCATCGAEIARLCD